MARLGAGNSLAEARARRRLDFVVVGAAKSGTTTLFELLRQHPELYLPPGKEDPFFSRDTTYHAGWNEYARRSFARASPITLWGTATPEYMAGTIYIRDHTLPDDAESEQALPFRIRDLSPDIRLIAILRDPVERCISHHRMYERLGVERRSVEHAVAESLTEEALVRARVSAAGTDNYVTWGEYGRILDGFYNVFARDQLRVIFLDELAEDPAGTIRSLFDHIGVNPEFQPDGLGLRYQPRIARSPYPRLDPFKVRLAASRVRPLRVAWHLVPQSGREHIDGAMSDVAYRTRLWTRTRPLSAGPVSDDVRSALGDHYRDDSIRLEALLGRTPPWVTSRRSVPVAANSMAVR